MSPNFLSLRRRLVVPLLAASSVAAIVVAVVSYELASRTAQAESRHRFAAMQRVVQASNFPLTRNVLDMLAKLTDALWFSVDSQGNVVEYSTLDSESSSSIPLTNQFPINDLPLSDLEVAPTILTFGKTNYQAVRIGKLASRRQSSTDAANELVVLVDDSQRQQTLYRAAAIPLLTGLSTILLLTSIAWFITERMIQRIARLQLEVDAIARGDFERSIQTGMEDELGLLSQSVQKMADQLSQMWQALRQNQGQQLLHQISGGLAHNLRNTLTGARMAIELEQRRSLSGINSTPTTSPGQPTGLAIAVGQLEQAEAYVQRLLLVSRGQEAERQPALIRDCLDGLRPGLENSAEHRGVKIKWRYSDAFKLQRVADGPTLVAAISNLVWNAIEAGKNVDVSLELPSEANCLISVVDDGPGPPESIQSQLFEPFVTSKSEGLGLGLPLVRRAAESLGGQVRWYRSNDQTVFEFSFPVIIDEAQQ